MEIKDIVKELAPVIETSIKESAEAVQKINSEKFDSMEKELKEIKLAQKEVVSDVQVSEKMKQTIIGNTFKSIAAQAQVSEAQFKEAFQASAKAAFNNETTAGEGAEFVFTQFENDILVVMKEYKLVNELNIYTIKGNELKIPKGINNITTAWVAEGGTIGKSKAGSAFITINTYKAATLVPFTEELLKDNMTTPDYYNLIVKMIGESQGAFIEDEVINGTDATKIEWILVNANVNVGTAGAGETKLKDMSFVDFDNLLTDTDALIGAEYETRPENAIAVMSKYVLNKLMRMKLTTGAYAYPELRTTEKTLLGKYRVIVSHKAPMQNAAADVAGATIMAFGDFKSFFGLAVSEGMILTRGFADGDFEADLQSVKARRRAGGKALFGEAFAKLKNAAA